jgi:predicted nucleic acid-binding protein
VIAYPDTSFLCALYVAQSSSAAAIAHYRSMKGPLGVSALLLYEFRQSVRLQIFRHSRDASQGYGRKEGGKALALLQANLEAGALTVMTADWTDVIKRAEGISAGFTPEGGHRALDVLHVATARHLGAHEFLSFDGNQRRLAAAQGMKPLP